MQNNHLAHYPPSNQRSYRISPVATACVALLLAQVGVHAQQAPAALTSVTVTGIRAGIESSIAAKRNSDSIIEVVTAEDIGKLPDASIAESLARLPGLTGQRGADGRVDVISIRGLSPAFSGALLNGREMVSSNDGRAVEYDQFPSELVGSAVVYKTPDAGLVGQGLSGTVDIRTLRPLDIKGRQMAVNLRGETNSNGNVVEGVAPKIGSRFSISYVDQFADNTIGLAVGFARLNSATQLRQVKNSVVGDWGACCGIPLAGNVPATNGGGLALLPMFWVGEVNSKSNVRDGLMATLEYKPNADLHSTLDLYYSNFDAHAVGGAFTQQMFGAWGGPGTDITLSNVKTADIGKNTFVTSATATNMPTIVNTLQTDRKDVIAAFGWNTSLKLDKQWTAIADVSMSRDEKNETYSESLAAPYANGNWVLGTQSWKNTYAAGVTPTWTTNQNLNDPNTLKLGDPFGYVTSQPGWAGVLRKPNNLDTLNALRFSFKRELANDVFSNFTGGLNYSTRDKESAKNEIRLVLNKDAQGNFIRDIPVSAQRSSVDASFFGMGPLLRLDFSDLLRNGVFYTKQVYAEQAQNNSAIHEKITTVFGKLDIDTVVAGIPVRGNTGVQAVYSQQSAEGFEYFGDDINPDINLVVRRTGGKSYVDYLPSLNLAADLSGGLIARFGYAKTIARPYIFDMRAGGSPPRLLTADGPDKGTWTMAYSGNPELEPWRANAADISIEKYFGKRSYVSVAAFHKQLQNYVFNAVTTRDNSIYPNNTGVTPVTKFGQVTRPENGHGGMVGGIELSASLEGGLISPMLDGFGVVFSGSSLRSSIKENDEEDKPLNGLSGISKSMTVYYEKEGFSARVSQRYRSAFTSTSRDVFTKLTTRQQAADEVTDLQFGYAFESGPYKGVSFLLQVNNLNDNIITNNITPGNGAADMTQLIPEYMSQYGRQVLFGVNYRF